MGNCQAVDAAALVIQHPSGKIERLYWPVTASEVMRTNPGHYVSLIIPLPNSSSGEEHQEQKTTVQFTRVKLLRPSDTLALGHAYRLVTTQEVMKVLRAKKSAKMNRQQSEAAAAAVDKSQAAISDKQKASDCQLQGRKSDVENKDSQQVVKQQKHHRPRAPSVNNAAAVVSRTKSWRPSLQSISEAAGS
ncbi:hypothetical protein Tsubulata_030938 [Turnera subulata]|uniref:DUF4228 domain-containing protein n=1 Tax=Turnera subulata TaxID=218843 RepID=A0A9Q0GD84_9ROSI|nr:hypothetical protein Tsubulata_030938 [Turnera subulata]